jgi:hypothetical protein
MITNFKIFENKISVGSIVVCIDDEHATGIKKGELYEVEEIIYTGRTKAIRFKGSDDLYLMSRFITQFDSDIKNYNL